MKLEKKSKIWVPFAFLLFVTCVLSIRCFFSFCQSDESFYAALIHRFWTGEHMITDEWNSTQFYTPLLVPYYGLFVSLRGTTAGVLLFLRILYVVFAAIVSGKLFYLVLKETEDHFLAAVAAAIVLLFCRGNIQGVSYYNLCMLCNVSAFCSVAAALNKNNRKQKLLLLWSGMLEACAVLCNPFLTPVVVVVLLVVLLSTKYRKESLCFIAGIVLMAGIYCLFLLHGNSLKEVAQGLTYVLNNPEQSSVLENLISAVRQARSFSKYVAIPALILTGIVLFTGNESTKRRLLPYYLALQTMLMAVSAVTSISKLCDAVVIPMTVVALPLCILSYQGKKLHAVGLYLFGILNALAYIIASNTGVDAGTVGFCISAAAGIWLIYDSCPEGNSNAFRTLTLALLSLSLLLPMFCQRVIGVYRDAPLKELTTELTQGPAEGLYTTADHARQYEAICDALGAFSEKYPEGTVLYCKTLPWAYLYTPYKYGTPSPWRIHTDDLENYYEVHRNKRADYICILSENVGGWEVSPLNRNPGVSTPNAFEYEGSFWESVKQAPKLTETSELIIYDMRGRWS